MRDYIDIPSKPKILNKLILIGNGFDLSLGLKTGYEDFLYWYFNTFIQTSLDNQSESKISGKFIKYYYHSDNQFEIYRRLARKLSIQEKEIIKFEMFNYKSCKDFFLDNKYDFVFNFNSHLLKTIFYKSINGWVDIEQTYFELLKKSLKDDSIDVNILNDELKELRSLLHTYLSQLDYSKTLDLNIALKHNNHFAKDISLEDIPAYFYDWDKIKTGHIMFLNFNYTESLSSIISSLPSLFISDKKKYEISHLQIHGSLKEDSESIIFGYGDEMDKDYKNIEELNDNKYFENIKSFKYLQNNSYSEILKYIDSEEYQIVIYGHSCGLSDRVLLNEIFEHKNCKSIKIYYYEKSEFINKTMDISRHFNSNQLMRKKIVAYSDDDLIPQSI